LEQEKASIEKLTSSLNEKSQEVASISKQLTESQNATESANRKLENLSQAKADSEKQLTAIISELKTKAQNADDVMRSKVRELTKLEELTKTEMVGFLFLKTIFI